MKDEASFSPVTRWARPIALAVAVLVLILAVTRLVSEGRGGEREVELSDVVLRSLPETAPYPNALLAQGSFTIANPIPGITPEPGKTPPQQSTPQARELRAQLKKLGLVDGYARIWAGQTSSSIVSILAMRLEKTAVLSSDTKLPLGNSFDVPDAPTTQVDTGIANSQAFVLNLEQEGGGGWMGWVNFVRGRHLVTVQAFMSSKEDVEKVVTELGKLQDDEARRLGLT